MLSPVWVQDSLSAYFNPILQRQPSSTSTTATFNDVSLTYRVSRVASMIESGYRITMEVCGFVSLLVGTDFVGWGDLSSTVWGC